MPSLYALIWNLLRFLAEDGRKQLSLIRDYEQNWEGKLDIPPHVQRPIIELAEGVGKLYSVFCVEETAPTELLELLEELEAVVTLMFCVSLEQYAADEAILESAPWRLVRRLSKLALFHFVSGNDELSVHDLLCYVSD
jgi:hypothetical protein